MSHLLARAKACVFHHYDACTARAAWAKEHYMHYEIKTDPLSFARTHTLLLLTCLPALITTVFRRCPAWY
jgi:hypothetical protein